MNTQQLELSRTPVAPNQYATSGTVQLGNQQHQWALWEGQQLGKHIAIDTETTLMQQHLFQYIISH